MPLINYSAFVFRKSNEDNNDSIAINLLGTFNTNGYIFNSVKIIVPSL